MIRVAVLKHGHRDNQEHIVRTKQAFGVNIKSSSAKMLLKC